MKLYLKNINVAIPYTVLTIQPQIIWKICKWTEFHNSAPFTLKGCFNPNLEQLVRPIGKEFQAKIWNIPILICLIQAIKISL